MSVVILGVTAGFCPINLVMVAPYMPGLLGSKGKISSAILFSIGILVVFVPLGIAFGSFGGLVLYDARHLLNIAGGRVMLVIGLWTLRLIRLPLSSMKVHKISGGIFVFGIAYALTIVGRGAPILISALSLVAFGGDFFTGGACADYLLLLPRNSAYDIRRCYGDFENRKKEEGAQKVCNT